MRGEKLITAMSERRVQVQHISSRVLFVFVGSGAMGSTPMSGIHFEQPWTAFPRWRMQLGDGRAVCRLLDESRRWRDMGAAAGGHCESKLRKYYKCIVQHL